MDISSVYHSIQNAYSNASQVVPKYRLASFSEMGNNIKKIALPAVALVSLFHVSAAEAGPFAYAECILICAEVTLGAFLPACLAACAPLLAAPTP